MIEFRVQRYKNSISMLRHAVGVGVPENRGSGSVEVVCGNMNFRYQIQDIYLTHMKETSASTWSEIKKHNYSQMQISDTFQVNGTKIRNALSKSMPSGPELALVILATSEAVRSQVIYQVVQQMLNKFNLKLSWSELTPILIGSWAHNTKENHKRRPIKYGALRDTDYYNKKATDAIQVIRQAGFMVQ